MKREIWINSYPDTIGGGATEPLHFLSIAIARDVDVHLVPNHKLMPAIKDWCESVGVQIHDYERGIFADKIVAGWCHLPMLTELSDWTNRRPLCSIWFNCMTNIDFAQRACHRNGWIDRWGFVSDYQRKMLCAELDSIAPVKEFEGYKPYFDPKHPLQGVKFEYREPKDEFVFGRISRDDPLKFPPDAWDIFRFSDPGQRGKRIVILGAGPNIRRSSMPQFLQGAEPVSGGNFINYEPRHFCQWDILLPGAITIQDFYSRLHCLIHKTGGSRESYGRFVVEAACAGVPCIVEDDFAFTELIIHGETGFLCESSDEMVETASMLARDEATRKRIIYAAYDHVTKNLIDADKCWEPWEKLFQEFA